MRATVVVSLLALLCPAVALAQAQPAAVTAPAAAPPPAATTPAPKRGADITRDAYIERAKHAAEKRFDRMDADHDGVLTGDERRAARTKRATPHPSKPQ
jgi:hypothetical protein